MEDNARISENIKRLRERFGYTQAFVANYLKLSAAAVNQYENDARTIPTAVIAQLAILYNVEEFDLYENDPEKKSLISSFAFRAEEITSTDLQTVSKFKKIIYNYINMSKALANG